MKHRLGRASLGVLTILATFGLAHAGDGIEIRTSGAHFFKRAITNTNPQTTSSTTFVDLPGAITTVFVPPQSIVMINAGFDAEARCSNGTNPSQDWCEAQILFNGVEGAPQASTFGPDTFSMVSTNAGDHGFFSWAAHAFSRHHCIRNTGTAPIPVTVRVQWKVTNFGGAAAVPEFWLDDTALVVEMSRGCTQQGPVGGTGTSTPPDGQGKGDPQLGG